MKLDKLNETESQISWNYPMKLNKICFDILAGFQNQQQIKIHSEETNIDIWENLNFNQFK